MPEFYNEEILIGYNCSFSKQIWSHSQFLNFPATVLVIWYDIILFSYVDSAPTDISLLGSMIFLSLAQSKFVNSGINTPNVMIFGNFSIMKDLYLTWACDNLFPGLAPNCRTLKRVPGLGAWRGTRPGPGSLWWPPLWRPLARPLLNWQANKAKHKTNGINTLVLVLALLEMAISTSTELPPMICTSHVPSL